MKLVVLFLQEFISSFRKALVAAKAKVSDACREEHWLNEWRPREQELVRGFIRAKFPSKQEEATWAFSKVRDKILLMSFLAKDLSEAELLLRLEEISSAPNQQRTLLDHYVRDSLPKGAESLGNGTWQVSGKTSGA